MAIGVPLVTLVPYRINDRASLALDVVRALAAQLVLFGHAFDFFDVFSTLGEADPPPQIQRLAVVAFFLLSGFLIASTVDHKVRFPGYGFSPYLVDRFSRIYCGLVPALIFICAVDALPFERFEQTYPADNRGVDVLAANGLMLQEYPLTEIPTYGSGDPLWTLSVEWWLYILYGVLVLCRGRGLWIGVPLLLVASVSVAGNTLGGTGHGIAVVWFLGVAVYYLLRSTAVHELDTGLAAATAILLFLLALARVYLFAAGNAKAFDLHCAVLLAASLLALLCACSGRAPPVSRRARHIVRFFADYSYTLYLCHFSLLTLLFEWRGRIDDRLLLLLGVVVCNGVAWCLAYCGERWHRRLASWLKERLVHRR